MTSVPYIALFLPDADNTYQIQMKDEVAAAARAAGLEVRVWFSGNSVGNQARDLYGVVHAGTPPAAVLAMPVQETSLARLAGEAVAAKIPWFWLNRAPPDHEALRERQKRPLSCLVTPDQTEAGRVQGRQCRLLLGRGSKIVYVQGRASNSSALARAAGFREAMAGSGVEVLTTLDGNWTASDAERVITNWLRIMLSTGLQLDLVACQNDGMAAGVRRALARLAVECQRPDVARLPLLGTDGLPEIGQRMVDNRELAATVVLPVTGGVAVDWVHRILQGESPPAVVALRPRSYPDESSLASRRTV